MRAQPSIGDIQQAAHEYGHDYAKGSPHIRHDAIRTRLISTIQRVATDILDRRRRCRVLEIGAGHGAFTDHLVAVGAEVEITEMSAPSAEVLCHRFRHNKNVTVFHDPAGTRSFEGDPIDMVVCISVLHHIPDYVITVERLVDRVAAGGAFVSFQDPLWYPRQSWSSRRLDRIAYLSWRVCQGELRRGIATIVRRTRGIYDETNVADMSEYHVVRQGVDEVMLCRVLQAKFRDVELRRYWSTQSGILQRLGDTIATPNTFGIVALDRRSQHA